MLNSAIRQPPHSSFNPKTCWLLTTGEAGCFSQLKGLAERLGVVYEKKLITLPFPWKAFPGHLCPWPLSVTKFGDGRLTPPWPDLVLSCGRRTVAAALGIRRASRGQTKAIHIQDPMVPVHCFDAVIAPYHDACQGPNVLQTIGAIHHLTPEMIQSSVDEFKSHVRHLPSPFVTLLLGGTSHAFRFTDKIIEQLTSQLIHLHQVHGCSFLITPSVRTPVKVCEEIQKKLARIPTYIWSKQDPNPYKALLGLADYIMVTCDSISMISEACSTGKPVYLVKMAGSSKRQSLFFKDMEQKGCVRWFEGKLDTWNYTPLDETGRSVEFIKAMF